eukprot:COSAG02_NODE_3458_length_6701_cov_2.131475_4_plen_673_part_00
MLPPPLRRQLLAGLGLTVTGSGAVIYSWRHQETTAGIVGPESVDGIGSSPLWNFKFVGRTDELCALRALSATVGWAPVWLLRGDRGVGKTRLLHEHAERERQQGRTVVELSLRGEGLNSAQLAATLAQGLGLPGATSFEALSTELDERWRSTSAAAGAGASTATMVPLVIADDVPTDSTGVFTTDVSAELAKWACTTTAAGHTRVIIVARESLPSYQNTRSSLDRNSLLLQQTRMLWLDWLPVEDSRELAQSAVSDLVASNGTRNSNSEKEKDSTLQLGPECEPAIAGGDVLLPEEVHMASASGCPGEVIELLSTISTSTTEQKLALEPEEIGAGTSTQVSRDCAPTSAIQRAIARREAALLKLMGLPLLPPHGANSITDLVELVSIAGGSDGAISAAACRVVASWEIFARLAGLTPDGSSAESVGISPQELLQQWNDSGEGQSGFRRGGQMQWAEVCASLISGHLGMEALVRQRLGVPVPCSDRDRSVIAEIGTELVQSGALGMRPNNSSSRDWDSVVSAAGEGLEMSDSGLGGRIGDDDWDVVMGALTREAVVRLHSELQVAREAAMPAGGFMNNDPATWEACSDTNWAKGVRPEMAVVVALQLRQLVEVDEWQRTIDELALQSEYENFKRANAELERLAATSGHAASDAALRLMVDLDSARQRVRLKNT